MSLDLYHNVDILPGIPPITITDLDTALVSAIIDTAPYESVFLAFSTGALTDANCTSTLLFEDGDDSGLSDNAAVADEFLHGTEAAASPTFANDDTAYKIGYHGNKRYLRVTLTPAANNSGNFVAGGVWVCAHMKKLPRSTQADVT